MTAVAEATLAGRDVSRETWENLVAFEAAVRRWNPTVNLVSRGSLDDLWTRHIEDSAQIFEHCPPDARTWADLGSGGGFPGIVVAILAKERSPDLRVTLIESDLRKATFLRQLVREMALPADVLSERIESLPKRSADVVSARALAPLRNLLGMAETHLKPDGVGLFPKGEHHLEEIAEAKTVWDFDVEAHPSRLQPNAAILIVRKIKRAQHP
jgi:16S rRNA (guanine527-N7)-methyltransferase